MYLFYEFGFSKQRREGSLRSHVRGHWAEERVLILHIIMSSKTWDIEHETEQREQKERVTLHLAVMPLE